MVKNIKPELLCPVGGKLQLIAAVENGADAVYLGGASFNARMYADNFSSIESVEEAVDYAHLRNVKVYVTLNTIINDEEFKEAIKYATKLYEIGVDAVIVQDLGLINKITDILPDLPIHVSTQATIYSKEGIDALNSKNITRIVLARELSLDEIEEIVKRVDKEIEIFIHGALCVCYSGQCKLSSEIGARSGNRGKCAQPCRLLYKLNDNVEKHYLSTKDVCIIDILPKIIKSGAHSLKIEGRMKSPEYVAAVTRIYRKYIDKCYSEEKYEVDIEDKNILLQVFNRGNFSTGYLEEKNMQDIWCNGRPKHWGTYLGKVLEYDVKKNNIKVKLEQDISIGDLIEVVNKDLSSSVISFIRNSKNRVNTARKGNIVVIGDVKGKIDKNQDIYKITSKKLNDELKEYFKEKSLKKNNLKCKIKLKIGEKPEVNFKCKVLNKNFEVNIQDGIECEKGINKLLTEDDVRVQLSKTGDVPFKISDIEVDIQDGLMTSVSNLNNIRRKVIDLLSDKIIQSFKKPKINIKQNEYNELVSIEKNKRETKLSAYIYDMNLLDNLYGLEKLDRIYLSLENILSYKKEILEKLQKEKIYIYLPTITNREYKEYMLKNMDTIKEIGNVLITNMEHLELFKNTNINICLDNSFNIFNTEAVNKVCKYNIQGINLSNELTLDQINKIKVPINREIEVDIYGNIQVMYSNFCMLKAINKCGSCSKYRNTLTDRKGKKFPILFNNLQCTMQLLNSDKLLSKEATKNLNR